MASHGKEFDRKTMSDRAMIRIATIIPVDTDAMPEILVFIVLHCDISDLTKVVKICYKSKYSENKL